MTFISTLYAGFRYWQYHNAYGRWRTFTGKVTYIPEVDPACKFFIVNKDTLVRVSCDKTKLEQFNQSYLQFLRDHNSSTSGAENTTAPFDGQYDKDIKQGDIVTVKAVRFDPNGGSKYKWYEIRAAGTYVKKVK